MSEYSAPVISSTYPQCWPCPLKKFDPENPKEHLCTGDCMWAMKNLKTSETHCAIAVIAMNTENLDSLCSIPYIETAIETISQSH